MNKRIYKLILTLLCGLFLFFGQNSIFATSPYDETESVVFEGQQSYFKFNDRDITKYIVNNRWAKNIVFTEAEKKMMYAYTYNQATPINSEIDRVKGDIKQLAPDLQEKIALLDQATHRMTLPWNIILYRYVYENFLLDIGISQSDLEKYYVNKQFNPEILREIVAGTHYSKYSFMSTTAIKDAAMAHRPIELKLRVKRGAHAAFVEPYSYFPSELEFLLPRGGQLEVIGAYLSEDKKKLNIEVDFKSSL
ncbi:ADP-ribosyltransferase [Streptococcus catagoni]|uniref:ADP-ribosyltransferase n=1 Tax=Streptococcus catagoni TaxID=2654874 RepID=UPI0014078893|nr:ADP-ribosyltransferase [Streptococcus catagoni]